MLKDYVIMLNTYVVFSTQCPIMLKGYVIMFKRRVILCTKHMNLSIPLVIMQIGVLFCVHNILLCQKILVYYYVKLGYLVYKVYELVYTTSYYLNARVLFCSPSVFIVVKDYVIKLKRGDSRCCLVQLRGVVPENVRMRHCVDKTLRGFDIINISCRQVSLRQDDSNFNIMTYIFDIIKHRVDKSTPYADKIACLCKIITHYIDKFTSFLDKITLRCDKIK